LLYVAALLEEGTWTSDVDHCIVGRQLAERKKRHAVREIFRELLALRGEGTPADRIKTACCHVLQLGPRLRMPSRDELTRHFWTKPAQRLMEKNPGMTQAEAAQKVYVQRIMAASPGLSQAKAESALEETRRTGRWEWLEEKMTDVAFERPERGRRESREAEIHSTCCVSKVFPNLKRGMASYWRRNKTAFEITCRALRELMAKSMKPLSRKML